MLSTRIPSHCYLICIASLGLLPLAAHADTVIGDWEAGSADGWIDWGNQNSVTDPTNTAKYDFSSTGATLGSSALHLTQTGWNQSIAIKLQNVNDGGIAKSAFFANNALQIDVTLPATTVAGWTEIYQFVVNAPGWGFVDVTANPVPGAHWDYAPGGGPQQTHTLTLDYSQTLPFIATNANYVEFIFATNNDGQDTHNQYFFDNVRLITLPSAALWNGSNGNWSDTNNWTPGTIPNNGTAHYAATINSGSAVLDVPVAISSLTLGGSAGAWTGNIALGTKVLVVQPAAADKATALANLKDQIGYGTSTAGANGVSSASSLADPAHKITVVVDNALLHLTSLGGMTVDAGSLLVESTYIGDSNLDRKVDVTDLGILATYYGTTVPNGILQGDFNQDGKVDVTDLGLLATDYSLGTGGGSYTTTAVPEPASLAFLSLASVLLLRNSRRR